MTDKTSKSVKKIPLSYSLMNRIKKTVENSTGTTEENMGYDILYALMQER